ncbi:MAG TPA: ABC-2 family transporter protein [Acidimicrobiia bacterium]
MNGPRLAWVHFKVGAMYELQYRANLLVQLVHSGLALVTGLVAIGLVFAYTTDLDGWTKPELLAVMGVHILLSGVLRAWVQPNMQRVMWQVEEGEFDFVLTKPVDAQLLVSFRHFQIWQLVDVVVGAVVIIWSVTLIGGEVGWRQSIGFMLLLLCGGVILYCLWLMITTSAFKWVRVEEITQLMDGIYQTGRWPVAIYPPWLRFSLTFVVPLAFAITVPAGALAGRLTAATVALSVLVTGLLVIVTRSVWLYGLRYYTGASA